MKPLRVSDHALVRFLARAGGLDVEGVREYLEQSLLRAHDAASKIGLAEYSIKADGLEWHVRNSVVVTVVPEKAP